MLKSRTQDIQFYAQKWRKSENLSSADAFNLGFALTNQGLYSAALLADDLAIDLGVSDLCEAHNNKEHHRQQAFTG